MNTEQGVWILSVLAHFEAWYSELQSTVADALSGPLKDGLEKEIKEQAKTRVYDAYDGKGYRRGLIGDPVNLEAESDQTELRIRNVTVQQGSPGRLSETDFVETGDKAFHQPFPRPFMDEALEAYVDGQGKEDLASALRSHGFDVQ